MSFNGKEGAVISSAQAKDLTKNHRTNNPSWPKGQFIGRDAIEALLKEKDAQGIRLYYGEDSKGSKTLIAVAADSNEDDITSTIYDDMIPCPSRCGKRNDLNS